LILVLNIITSHKFAPLIPNTFTSIGCFAIASLLASIVADG
jgi:hypothetical protein